MKVISVLLFVVCIVVVAAGAGYDDDDDDEFYVDNRGPAYDDEEIEHQPSKDEWTGFKNKDVITNNCYHNGRLYHPGNEITENCNNCTCVDAIIQNEFNWKCTQKICIVQNRVLALVNDENKRNSWRASNYSMFWGLSLEAGARYFLGTHRPTSHVTGMSTVHTETDRDLPREFDARQEWPTLIGPVLDQKQCAASWAFSTAGVASDRLSIHSNGLFKHSLSPQHLISCNNDHGQHGCNSGHVDRAWWFIRKAGIVDLTCYPFASGTTIRKGTCSVPRSYLALKSSTCPSGRGPMTVFQASPPYRLPVSEKAIMKELIDNGPVQAVIEVKDDFYLYKSGVYQHMAETTNPKKLNPLKADFHSVRILGWGTDYSTGKPVKYWLCANSWGEDWGEDGYFRILRGSNEVNIESFVIGAWMKLNDRTLIKTRETFLEGAQKK